MPNIPSNFFLAKLPTDLLLGAIDIQKVFFDKKSHEESTGVIKIKYKLAGNFLKPLDIYTFFSITKNYQACSRYSTVEVNQPHWENKSQGHLDRPQSFIDARKVELLSKDDVLDKIRDQENRFVCVARLCDTKFEELKQKKDGLHLGGFVSEDRRLIARGALSDIADIDSISDEIMTKLDIV